MCVSKSSCTPAHALQHFMLLCMPESCASERMQLEQHLETQELLTGTYPTPEMLLKMISPILRTKKSSNLHVTTRGQQQQRCLNCWSDQHITSKCDKKCSPSEKPQRANSKLIYAPRVGSGP